jgi:hypothetical protein
MSTTTNFTRLDTEFALPCSYLHIDLKVKPLLIFSTIVANNWTGHFTIVLNSTTREIDFFSRTIPNIFAKIKNTHLKLLFIFASEMKVRA